MTVNSLILPRSQAVQVAEVIRGLEDRQFLHLLIGKSDEIFDISNFHNRVPLLYEKPQPFHPGKWAATAASQKTNPMLLIDRI